MNKYCLVCFSEIHNIFFDKKICDKCLKSMNPIFKKIKIENIEGIALYEYRDTIKELLYKFKGCNDIDLKDVFTYHYKLILSILFINYVIVYVPSYKEHNVNRGFNHVQEMFSCLSNKNKDCIIKINDIKQSSLNKDERNNVINNLKLLENAKELHNKNVLIVDDVLTTGSTIKACYKLLKQVTNKKIKFLVMSYVCR